MTDIKKLLEVMQSLRDAKDQEVIVIAMDGLILDVRPAPAGDDSGAQYQT